MGETLEFDCAGCGEPARMDSTSVNFIAGILPEADREDVKRCDGCLEELMAGTTIDVSIGGTTHTDSDEFEAERRARERHKNADEIEAAQNRHTVAIVDRYEGPDGRDRLEIDGPSEIKYDVKDLQSSLWGPDYDHARQAWTVIDHDVDDLVAHLREQGWTVTVDVA